MWAEYEVTGKRQYRGHDPGARFEAQHDRAKERAIGRGDIRMIRQHTPAAPHGGTLPWDWPPDPVSPVNQEAPQDASLAREGG